MSPSSRRLPLDLWLLPLAVLLFHVVTAPGYGYFRDELYYLASAEHLAWGYVEHPPFIGWMAALVRGTLGDGLYAIRFPAALAAALTVLLVGLAARDLGRRWGRDGAAFTAGSSGSDDRLVPTPGPAAGRKAAGEVRGGGVYARVLAMLAAAVTPIHLGLFGTFSMNAFDLLWWALAGWLLVRLLSGADPRWWLGFGLVAGVGLLTKLSFLFLGLGLVAGLVLARRWDVLRSPWLYAGGALAALLFLPHVLWQVAHDWPTLEFMDNARRLKNVDLPAGEFLREQLLITAPAGLLVAVPGVLWLLFARDARPWRAAGWIFPVVLATMLVLGAAKPYYLAPAYLLPFAAGGRAWEAWTARRRAVGRTGAQEGRPAPADGGAADGAPVVRRPGAADRFGRRWRLAVRVAVPTAVVVLAATLAPLAKALLPVDDFLVYADRLGVSAGSGERQELGRLPQFFADQHGWPELAATVAQVYRSLPPEDRERACVFAQNYGQAGAIDVLGRPLGLPPAISGHNSYYLWGPGDCSGEVLLVLDDSRDDLDRLFHDVRPGAVHHCTWCMPYEDGLTIWIARDPRVPLRDLWPQVKRYI